MVSHRTDHGVEGFYLLTHSPGELDPPYHPAMVNCGIYILKAIVASVYLQQYSWYLAAYRIERQNPSPYICSLVSANSFLSSKILSRHFCGSSITRIHLAFCGRSTLLLLVMGGQQHAKPPCCCYYAHLMSPSSATTSSATTFV